MCSGFSTHFVIMNLLIPSTSCNKVANKEKRHSHGLGSTCRPFTVDLASSQETCASRSSFALIDLFIVCYGGVS